MENKLNSCLNAAFTFLEKSMLNVESLSHIVGTHAMYDMRSTDPKKYLRIFVYCTGPGDGHSNMQ